MELKWAKKFLFVISICMSDVTVLMPQQTERGGCIVHPTVILSGVPAATVDVVTCFD